MTVIIPLSQEKAREKLFDNVNLLPGQETSVLSYKSVQRQPGPCRRGLVRVADGQQGDHIVSIVELQHALCLCRCRTS